MKSYKAFAKGRYFKKNSLLIVSPKAIVDIENQSSI